jgi:hypothetical protein
MTKPPCQPRSGAVLRQPIDKAREEKGRGDARHAGQDDDPGNEQQRPTIGLPVGAEDLGDRSEYGRLGHEKVANRGGEQEAPSLLGGYGADLLLPAELPKRHPQPLANDRLQTEDDPFDVEGPY